MSPGTYIVRRDVPAAVQSCAVVLAVLDGMSDVVTFDGMRSLVSVAVLASLWEPARDPTLLDWSWRKLPLTRDREPAQILWVDGVSRLEAWPWNDLRVAMANLAKVGLRCGALREVKMYGPEPYRAQLLTFDLTGTFREPIGAGPDFPPFAEET